MKKNWKIFKGIMIFIISFICIDGLCARFLGTRPIVSKMSVVMQGSAEIHSGYVYKSLFADVYYCDTIYESYDEEGNEIREEKISRHYIEKGSEFVCPLWINERSEINKEYREEAVKYTDIEYMKIEAEGLYRAGYYKSNSSFGSYNSKLGIYRHNFIGDSLYVSDEYQDIYMFDVNDFSKEPVKMEIDGFDLTWRSVNMMDSPDGNIMAFYYICGYRADQWMGWQKYKEEDCAVNDKENGIYVFRVNGINDYELLKYYSEERNEYLDEYKESYFRIYKIIDDENIILKYTVTHNKQEAPLLEVYYKWNIVNDTLREWQV